MGDILQLGRPLTVIEGKLLGCLLSIHFMKVIGWNVHKVMQVCHQVLNGRSYRVHRDLVVKAIRGPRHRQIMEQDRNKALHLDLSRVDQGFFGPVPAASAENRAFAYALWPVIPALVPRL